MQPAGWNEAIKLGAGEICDLIIPSDLIYMFHNRHSCWPSEVRSLTSPATNIQASFYYLDLIIIALMIRFIMNLCILVINNSGMFESLLVLMFLARTLPNNSGWLLSPKLGMKDHHLCFGKPCVGQFHHGQS